MGDTQDKKFGFYKGEMFGEHCHRVLELLKDKDFTLSKVLSILNEDSGFEWKPKPDGSPRSESTKVSDLSVFARANGIERRPGKSKPRKTKNIRAVDSDAALMRDMQITLNSNLPTRLKKIFVAGLSAGKI